MTEDPADRRDVQPVADLTALPTASSRIFDWSDPLTKFGVYVSAGWTIVSVVALWAFADWTNKLPPNEWGDLAAGFAAPLAFFWLVQGFLQQGKELRLSSRALMLQVEELRNTVKHQADLVQVTRDQVAVQLRQDEEQRRARQHSLRPRLLMMSAGMTSDIQGLRYTVRLTNIGATITKLRVEFIGGREFQFPMLADGEPQQFKITFPRDQAAPINGIIHFTNAEEVQGAVVFVGTIDAAKQLSFVISPGGVFA